MSIITAHIDNSKYKTTIRSEAEHIIIADEPIESGGTNLGFSPSELLAAALASCTAITLRMYADRKKWNLIDIITKVDIQKTDDNPTVFNRKIKLFGELNTEQIEKLLNIAHKCPVHKILSNQIQIKTNLE